MRKPQTVAFAFHAAGSTVFRVEIGENSFAESQRDEDFFFEEQAVVDNV